ncbi:unnamed protein product [Blepharisma stoltei]|uniref:Structural maintenance of chromosomes protein n=1 Tax=Blepharisma stoltei TaxID=1481888 RepID=A0AAU9J344_9CILI|nr:unnamed protein product [Blepharisma stoltei]
MSVPHRARARIDHLHLYNFKSFSEDHDIGPFLDFTAIIGPNGGGKSNIMDAISFVLGVRSADLRATNLKELVYRKENEKVSDNCRSTYVELYFYTEEDEQIIFKRTISPTGISEYFINENKQASDAYQETLQRFNILVKARNFLIFQGQVDSLAMKSGKELTALFEKISGSDDYKAAYEESKAQMESCEENMKTISNKLTYLTNEKKKLKEQKSHAKDYENLINKVKALQVTYQLLQFSILEREIAGKNKQVDGKKKGLEDARIKKEKSAVGLRESGNNFKQYEQELMNVIDDLANKNNLILIKKPELNKLKENLKQFQLRIQAKEDSLEQLKTNLDNSKKRSEQMKNELIIFDEEIQKKLHEQIQELKVDLDETQKERYMQLKKEAGLRSFMEKKELERVKRELGSKEMNFSYLKQSHNAKLEEKSKLDEDISGLEQQLNRKNDEKSRFEEVRSDTLNEIKKATMKNEKDKERELELVERLRMLEGKVREYETVSLVKKEKEKEKTIVADMMRQNKKVRGFFRDLVVPIQPRYSMAVEASLGSILDYLVVEDAETAAFVHTKLKENSLLKDIVVLENVPEGQVNESLRHQVSNLGTLLPDILTYDRNYGLDKAVLAFAGSRVVAEDINKAESLRRVKGIRQVVTIDGVTIKNGMISSAPSKKRFEKGSQKLDILVKETEDIRAQLHDLQQSLRGENTLANLKQNLVEYENKIASIDNEIAGMSEKMQNLMGNRKDLIKDTKAIENQLNLLQRQISTQKDQLFAIESSISSIEDSVFSDFCRELGIENIKSLEGKGLEEANKLQEEINRLRQEYSKVEWQLSSLNLESSEEAVSRMKSSIAKDKSELTKINDRYQELDKELNKLKDAQAQLKSSEDKLKEEIQRMKDLLTSQQDKFDKTLKACSILEKDLSNEERELEHLYQQKQQRIEEFQMKNLDVPLRRTDDDTPDIDFSGLDVKYVRMSSEQLDKESESIASLIEKESKNLEQLASSGKCTFNQDKLEDLERKEEETTKQLEDFNRLLNDAKANFQEIKEKRRFCFMNMFNSVEGAINRIYKEMTKSSKNNYYGGSALLYVEDSDEPYNGGVVYSPTPPGKRCMYEMEQLSGGEKTIAALSLLFAVHSAMPSPFYILDEIDAFLDFDNCQLLLNYLQKVAEENSQCIIITHKEDFFSNSDSLIGTTFLPLESTSKSFSLDMRGYGPKQMAAI